MSGGEGSAGLVCHGMYDSQQSVGEGHTSQALCVVHLLSGIHIASVGSRKVFQYHLDGLQCQRIGERTMQGGNVCLDGVSQRIHTCVSHLFCRKVGNQIGINDCHIRGDIEVSQRIFHTGLIVGDYGECSYLCCRAGSGRDGCKFCFLTQLREIKRNAQILEGGIRVLVECPHSLCCVDRGTATHGYDPVRLELSHHSCALHNSLNGRIRLNNLNQLYFHTCFLQVCNCAIQEALFLHGTAANNEDSLLALQVLQLFKTSFSVINISG